MGVCVSTCVRFHTFAGVRFISHRTTNQHTQNETHHITSHFMDFHAIDHLLISDKAMRSFLERNMYQSLSYALRSVRFIEAWVSILHTTTWNTRWWWWWEWSRQLTQTETFCQCDYVARHIVGIVCWIFCLLLLLPLPQPLPLLLIRFWLLLRKTDCGKTKWKRKKTHNTNREQTASIERPQAKRFFYFFVILYLSLSLFLGLCFVLFDEVNAPAMKKQRSARTINGGKQNEEEVKDEVYGNEDNMRLYFLWLSLTQLLVYVRQVLKNSMWYNESL